MTDRLITGALKLYTGLIFLFIFAPIISLVVFSFNAERFPRLPWRGFTTHWYRVLNDDPEIFASFKNSLVVGVIVAVVATFLGASAGYFLNRWNFRGKSVYLGIAVLPPCIPLIILGLALLIFLRQINLSGSLTSVVLSHIVLASAFGLGIVRMRLSEMDQSLEEAAWNLGASEWRTMRKVVLPQAAPAIVAALLITMAVSWDEFIISWFVSGLDATLPVKIFNLLQGTVSPRVNAIGAIVFAITITLVILAQLAFFVWGRRSRARRVLAVGGAEEQSPAAELSVRGA